MLSLTSIDSQREEGAGAKRVAPSGGEVTLRTECMYAIWLASLTAHGGKGGEKARWIGKPLYLLNNMCIHLSLSLSLHIYIYMYIIHIYICVYIIERQKYGEKQ